MGAKAAIIVLKGDITDQATDAIVNAANNHLWMGAGVAGAIRRRGGPDIETEAVAKGPIMVGESVLTGAGTLPARYVVHAAVMGQDLATDAAKIRAATRSALRLAEEQELTSISFPALGTGVGGFPVRQCASIMLAEARRIARSSRSLREIRFVLIDETGYAAFVDALRTSNERHVR